MPEETDVAASSSTKAVEEKPCSSSAAESSVDVFEEAKKLIGTGNRHLVMKDVVSAVSVFQEACAMLAEKYGDTADECGEAFFLCGKSLLELARMENSVLGNALEGVPEESSEEGEKHNDSKIESADNLDEKTRDELREQVYEAMSEKSDSQEGEPKVGKEQEVKEERMEEAGAPSENREEAEAPSENREEAEAPSENREEAEAPSENREEAEAPSENREEAEAPSENREEAGAPSENREEAGAPSENREEAEAPSENREEAEAPSENREAAGAPSENREAAGAPSENREAAGAPSENREAAGAPSENREAAGAPSENREEAEAPAENREEAEAPAENQESTENLKSEVQTSGSIKELDNAVSSKQEGPEFTREAKEDTEKNEDQGENEEQPEPMEEDAGDAEDDDDDDEEADENAEDKEGEEEEDVGNLQLAWEMLEVAKVIYKRKESKEDQLMAAQIFLKLGEVGVESGNYSQALDDFQECLAIQLKHLPPHSRLLAETHYQLGMTFNYTGQYNQAIQHFSSSIKVIESRLAMLQEIIDKTEGAEGAAEEKRELEELKELLPEIVEKVEDAKESQRTAPAATEAIQQTLGGASTSSGFATENGASSTAALIAVKPADGASSSKSASDISHLVRKKAVNSSTSAEATA
ncbi:nuclear autoantigenic sperm protein isoform X2 [Tachysurus vachellii]|uniref:nuclear autoantigenic sperm protein isoform X2 n=1 Tax=Tachysurus vachellii TaxID=175792 RepID=UPI00296B47BB|nr:nuclear autoantigenic sperm protein isoform X2 [Tachysurus vachellii]